jgi:hypothetical protein
MGEDDQYEDRADRGSRNQPPHKKTPFLYFSRPEFYASTLLSSYLQLHSIFSPVRVIGRVDGMQPVHLWPEHVADAILPGASLKIPSAGVVGVLLLAEPAEV